jgi:hypothetical protein
MAFKITRESGTPVTLDGAVFEIVNGVLLIEKDSRRIAAFCPGDWQTVQQVDVDLFTPEQVNKAVITALGDLRAEAVRERSAARLPQSTAAFTTIIEAIDERLNDLDNV